MDAAIQGLGLLFLKESEYIPKFILCYLADTTMASQAYPPVLLERKAAAIRKSMDEEKAPGVTIRISMETTDRQCVGHILILSLMLIFLAAGGPCSAKVSFAHSGCSSTNQLSNSLVYIWHMYMAFFIVRTLAFLQFYLV